MPILLGIVIPTLLVFSPFIILGLTRLSKPGTNKVQFGIAIMLCFLIGLGVPMMATMISAVGLTYNFGHDDAKCAVGAAVFFMLGYGVNLIGLPIFALLLFPWKGRINNE